MIFAEKLIRLRKQSGWSQEELAEQMGVTRQSVSKWEGAQSVPDLEKLLQLSRLFGVSLDYLLKDELEEAPAEQAGEQRDLRRLTLAQASAFLAGKQRAAGPMAAGTLLAILSPVCLLLLGARSEAPGSAVSENMAAGLGLTALLALVAGAVALFLLAGRHTEPFGWLEKESFDAEYGVEGLARARQEAGRSAHQRAVTLGVSLCILSVVPLFVGMAVKEEDLFLAAMLCLSLVIAAAGASLLVKEETVWESYRILLQEEDYTAEKKASRPRRRAFSTAYWLLVTAVYLAVSLPTHNWRESWIIWPVAGVVFPALLAVAGLFPRRR